MFGNKYSSNTDCKFILYKRNTIHLFIFYLVFCFIFSFCYSFENINSPSTSSSSFTSSFDSFSFENNTSILEIYATWNNSSPCAGSQCFSADCPCPSIQAALDVATNAQNYTDIFIILLSGGSYNGTDNSNLVCVTSSNLFITSNDSSIVDVEATYFMNQGFDNVNSVHLSNMRISDKNTNSGNFTGRTKAPRFVYNNFKNNSMFTMTNIIISDIYFQSIFMIKAQQLHINNCEFYNISHGGDNQFKGELYELKNTTFQDIIITIPFSYINAEIIVSNVEIHNTFTEYPFIMRSLPTNVLLSSATISNITISWSALIFFNSNDFFVNFFCETITATNSRLQLFKGSSCGSLMIGELSFTNVTSGSEIINAIGVTNSILTFSNFDLVNQINEVGDPIFCNAASFDSVFLENIFVDNANFFYFMEFNIVKLLQINNIDFRNIKLDFHLIHATISNLVYIKNLSLDKITFTHSTSANSLILFDTNNVRDVYAELTDSSVSNSEIDSSSNVGNKQHALFGFYNFGGIIINNISFENVTFSLLHIQFTTNVDISNITVTNVKRQFADLIELYNIENLEVSNINSNNTLYHGPFAFISIENSTGIVYNCNFQNSGNLILGEGVMRMKYSTISVTDCIFENCFAKRAGGIYFYYSDITISNNTFTNCSAGLSFGGAMLSDCSTFTFIENKVENCSAKQNGGGIFSSNSTAYISYNLFTLNSAQRYGGAIFSMSSVNANTFLSYSTFTNNYALEGAVISGDTVNFQISDCTFSDNFAIANGGAISAYGYSYFNVLDTIFDTNNAGSSAGAISFYQFSKSILEGATFTNNTSVTSGGAIVLHDSAEIEIKDSTFSLNSAGIGGAILVETSETVNIYNSTIIDNYASSAGGGLHGRSNATIIISETVFERNTASSGGAILSENFINTTITDSSFNNNIAYSRGGAIVFGDACVALIKFCNFIQNNATFTSGGAILIQDQAYTKVQFCNFIENFGASGGAIAVTSSKIALFEESFILENSSTFSGGGILIQFGGIKFINCTCSDNISYGNGGCMAITESAKPHLENVIIKNNTANNHGGGIYCYDNVAPNITDSVILYNTAESNGGGIYMDYHTSGNIQHCDINYNTANSGGAIYNEGAALVFNNILCFNNSAQFGGALTFILNTPAITSTSGFVLFNNFVLQNNSATFGGGVYLLPSRLPVELKDSIPIFSSTVLEYNYAQFGGAVYIYDNVIPPAFIPPTLFNNNYAKKMGGAIYVNSAYETTTSWLTNSVFSHNTAGWAGSSVAWILLLNVTESDTFCNNCTFTPNNSTGYQNNNGFATYPWKIKLYESCPSSVLLQNNPFTISAGIFDEFGTLVDGNMLLNNTISIKIASECLAANISQTLDSSGLAIFTDISLRGHNNQTCSLFVDAISPLGVPVIGEKCDILLLGCAENEKIVTGDSYDTCVAVTLTPTMILWITISCLIFCIGVVLVLLLLGVIRKRIKYKKRMKELSPLFTERPNVTIENILRDPDIPKVNWNHLTIEKQIGIGAAGLVSKAILTENGEETPVALKELIVGLELLNESVINEFLVEIKLMSAMKHPNIVKFIGICCPDAEKIYLVTELMELGSVKDLLISQPHLSWQDRISLMVGAAKGLKYLHDNKLIHRDIKPHNLLVNGDLACKIADFGISTVMPENTRTMTCVGTPVYMAPEVLSLDKYSAKADVYSFGILLMEIITDLRPYSIGPFARVSNPVLMHQIIENNVRPEHGPLPEPLQQLVDECIDGRSDTRPDFDEIITRLERLELLEIDIFDILMYSRKLEKENDELY